MFWYEACGVNEIKAMQMLIIFKKKFEKKKLWHYKRINEVWGIWGDRPNEKFRKSRNM